MAARTGSQIEGDILEHHFDRTVGFAVYALLFVSSFFAGLPGLVGAALAYAHRKGASRLMATHYRFQLRIFWTCLIFFVLGMVALVGAAALGLTELLRYVPPEWLASVGLSGDSESAGLLAWALLAVGIALLFASWVWSLAAPAYGFLKLVGSRAIGHDDDDDF